MSKPLTEQKVLKKLGIEDFRHLSKDKTEKRSGADRFTRKKSSGSAAPTLKRESRHVKG